MKSEAEITEEDTLVARLDIGRADATLYNLMVSVKGDTTIEPFSANAKTIAGDFRENEYSHAEVLAALSRFAEEGEEEVAFAALVERYFSGIIYLN